MKLFSHFAVMLLLLGSYSLFGQAKQDRTTDRGADKAAAHASTEPPSNNQAGSTADRTPAQETVYQVGNGVSAPRAVYTPDPEFPEKPPRNWKKQKPAKVILSFVVTSEGKVRDIRITTSSNRDLEKAAVAAVSQWIFKPGTNDGKAVAVRTSAEVDYELY